MIKKKVLDKSRIRRIDGGFSFIPHRFLTDGFVRALHPKEMLLYFFLVLASDRNGLSFYSYDAICTLLEMDLDQYIAARDRLIEKDPSAVPRLTRAIADYLHWMKSVNYTPASRHLHRVQLELFLDFVKSKRLGWQELTRIFERLPFSCPGPGRYPPWSGAAAATWAGDRWLFGGRFPRPDNFLSSPERTRANKR